MPDVFGHGMLSMAYLAQLITHWAPQDRLLSWTVRFTAIPPLYATVTATGEVTEIFDDGERRCARLAVRTVTAAGTTTLEGEAVLQNNCEGEEYDHIGRQEDLRVGKERGSTCRTGCSRYNYN